MKKMIILFSAVLVGSGLFAQKVYLGIKGGLNVANYANANNNEALLSFYAGGLAHIHINEHFAVQPELVYSGQGARFNNGNNADTRARLDYINIPLLFQYMAGDGFRLETGPQFGILAAAKNKTGNVTVKVQDAYKTGDFGWVFGASYLTPSRLGVSARYNLGLTDITENNNTNFRNSVFSVGLFYLFQPR